MDSSYAWYVNGADNGFTRSPLLAYQAITKADPDINYAQWKTQMNLVEGVIILHAGPGAEFTGNSDDIWSHSWTLRNPRSYDGVTIGDYVIQPEYFVNVSSTDSDMTIGVFAHEMGHGFWNLPDVYDRANDGTRSWGMGDWSLMGFGSWNGPNSGGWGSDGSSPAWPDAWNRVIMGVDSYRMILSPGTASS